MNNKLIILWAAAALSGMLLTLTFPKLEWHLLAWVALVPLLVVLAFQTPRKAFKIGWFCGLVHYVTLLPWLVDTMRLYGGLPLVVGGSILFLLAGYLALFTGGFAMALVYAAHRPGMLIVAAPALWVALEYLRSFLLTGFPWALLGYSQYQQTLIIQMADLGGVYIISAVIVAVNTAVCILWLYLRQQPWQGRLVSRRTAGSSIVISGLLLAAAGGYGFWRLEHLQHQTLEASTVTTALVQGNIDQAIKWDPAFQLETLQKYLNMSEAVALKRPDLVIWPETATPFYFMRDVPLSARITHLVQQTRTPFLIGSPYYVYDNTTPRYYNSAWLIQADGHIAGRYDKSHLVPFGEYVPLKRWLPFLGKIVEHVGDFEGGPAGRTLQHQDLALGILICYESIFPYLGRRHAQNGANLLVIMTNDAWYGTSRGPYQHFSMAVLRAVETRRSLVRVANTGISAFIEADGRVYQPTELLVDATGYRELPLLNIETLYTRWGDAFAIMGGVIGLVLMGGRVLLRGYHRSSSDRNSPASFR